MPKSGFMCLGLPLRIIKIDPEGRGWVDLDGLPQPVDLRLIDTPREGEFVIVHAGFAIERLDPDEAESRIAVLRSLS